MDSAVFFPLRKRNSHYSRALPVTEVASRSAVSSPSDLTSADSSVRPSHWERRLIGAFHPGSTSSVILSLQRVLMQSQAQTVVSTGPHGDLSLLENSTVCWEHLNHGFRPKK